MKFAKPTDQPGEKEIEEPGFFTKLFSRFRKSVTEKMGTPTETVKVEMFTYHIRINTGAGILKASVKAANKADAEKTALVNYVRNVKVSAELYKH